MNRKPLAILLLCITCVSCTQESRQTDNTIAKEKSSITEDPYLSRDDVQILERISSKTLDKIRKGNTLDFNDVISMQRSGIQSDTMIQLLLITHSKFTLTTADIIKLQTEGVPFKVINFMIRT